MSTVVKDRAVIVAIVDAVIEIEQAARLLDETGKGVVVRLRIPEQLTRDPPVIQLHRNRNALAGRCGT